MGTRPHLSFCAYKTVTFGTELQVSMGSSPHLWFFALKTAPLELKSHVCMGQTSPVVLYMQSSVISTRITSLYGSQPTAVVIACKTASFGPE